MTVTVLRSKGEDPERTVSVSRPGPAVPLSRTGARLPVPGEIVGNKYRIEAWLGQGGMGAVFRATQLVSEKPVALKWMLRPHSHAQARARFLREARAAGRIHHPNVVDVYDVGEDAEFDFLVMELLRGESLRARLDRGALRVDEAVDLLVPAMLGVAAAHRAGVIHRDLKPDNVFLCESGDEQPSEAKVLDFGISQITSSDLGEPITRDGAVLGTPSYMSPEQLKDARNVDARTDIYSLAVIFYEAITRRLPFCESSYSGLVLAIAQSDPPAPSTLAPDVPRAFEQVLLRAMARDRDQRHPDMESFVAAVRPFGSRHAGEPLAVRASEQARHQASFGGSAPAARAHEPAPSRASARNARRRPALGLAALVVLLLAIWWVSRGQPVTARSKVASRAVATAVSRPAAHTLELVAAREPSVVAQRPVAVVGAPAAKVAAQPEPPQSARAEVADIAAAQLPPRARPASRARASATVGGIAPAPRGGAMQVGQSIRPPSQAVGRSGTISLDDM